MSKSYVNESEYFYRGEREGFLSGDAYEHMTLFWRVDLIDRFPK